MIKFLHSIKNDLLLTGKIRDEYISIENIVVKEQFKDYSKPTKLLTPKNPAFDLRIDKLPLTQFLVLFHNVTT